MNIEKIQTLCRFFGLTIGREGFREKSIGDSENAAIYSLECHEDFVFFSVDEKTGNDRTSVLSGQFRIEPSKNALVAEKMTLMGLDSEEDDFMDNLQEHIHILTGN